MNNQNKELYAIKKAGKIKNDINKWIKMANNKNISQFKKAQNAWNMWENMEKFFETILRIYRDDFFYFATNNEGDDKDTWYGEKELHL